MFSLDKFKAGAASALGFPLHQVLLAIYFPVWLMSNNFGIFEISQLVRPLVISIGAALGIFAVFRLLYRDSHKAGFVTTIVILALYSFSYFAGLIHIPLRELVVSICLVAICLIIGIYTYKTNRIGRTTSLVLNGFIAAMLILPAYKIGTFEFEKTADIPHVAESSNVVANKSSEFPNIIHIVLDGYSRTDVLKELYNFDNSEFLDALRALGFTIVDDATVPYGQTLLTMNSVFALDFINDRVVSLSESLSEEGERMNTSLRRDLEKSAVLEFLKSNGYRIIVIESLYPDVRLQNVDHTISFKGEDDGITYLESTLLLYTPLSYLFQALNLRSESYSHNKFALAKHELGAFNPPYFVYNHIIAPHPPFNMTGDGRLRTDPYGWADGSHRRDSDADFYESYRDGYIEKLRYTNGAILDKLQDLVSSVPDPKIIVVHSDHGGGLYLDQESKANTCLKERFSALLAVYSSDKRVTEGFPRTVNLANLYRILFNRGFGGDYALLPNRSYFAAWSNPTAFEIVEVDELRRFGPTCRKSAGASQGSTQASN